MVEANGYHSRFAGFVPAPAATVVESYATSDDGVQAGRVIVA